MKEKMREIKFRAWDKKTLKMRLFDLYELASRGVCAILFNETSTFSQYESCPKRNEDLVVMQFTGFLDKNGKEIYEGDIFRALHDFGPSGFSERISSIPTEHKMDIEWQYWDIKTIEIIGNIYENPELMNGRE